MAGYPIRRTLGRFGMVAVAFLAPSGCKAGEDTVPMPPAAAVGAPKAPGTPSTAVRDAVPAVPAGRALVIFGRDTVVAEVARSSEEREKGLMGRTDLPAGTGMLFVFAEAQYRSFWMSDTYVPLDIAFMDSSLRVIDIQQMEPQTTDFHDSKGPAMYALEVPKGWLAAHGIRVGAQAKLVVG